MSTFVDAVNRILRIEGIISGDDDEIADFTSTQHVASIQVAKIAIQNEIAYFADELKLPYERTTGTVTATTSTRTYSLPTDFIRFTAEPMLWEVGSDGEVDHTFVSRVDEDHVRRVDASYETLEGTPTWFYFIGSTTYQIGLYPVPDSGNNAQIYKFWYDKSINVTTSTDSVPFITTEQFNAFCNSAARQFKFLRLRPDERNVLFPQGLERDAELETMRATVIRQTMPFKYPEKYGRRYG